MSPRTETFLAILVDRGRRPWRPSNLPRSFVPKHTIAAAEEVRRRLGEHTLRPPTTTELSETYSVVSEAWRSQRSFEGLPRIHLRRLPWIFFYPRETAADWLASDRRFVRRYFELVDRRGNASRGITALLREFLEAYPEGLQTFEELRRELRARVLGSRSIGLLRWAERCARYPLLERSGPEELAERWLHATSDWQAFGEETGFTAGLEASTFLVRTTRHLLDVASSRLANDRLSTDDLQRILAWLGDPESRRFESMRVPMTEALLSPFAARPATPAVREPIQEYLLARLGDPRLVSAAGWTGVSEASRNVMLGWLTRVTLEAFFELLDRTALDAHWRYRKAFWNAYLERGQIHGAWIVLGRAAAEQGRRLDAGAWGRLGGGASSQSVLLLQFPDFVVAEWSHNGSCRTWLAGNRSAPKLYRPAYQRYELVRGADFEQPHIGSDQLSWQHKVGRWIEGQTGVRIDPSSWRPGRPPARRRR